MSFKKTYQKVGGKTIVVWVGEGIHAGKTAAGVSAKRLNEVYGGDYARETEKEQPLPPPPSTTQHYVSDPVAQQTRPVSPYEAQSISDQQEQQQEQQAASVVAAIEQPEKVQPGVAEVREVEKSKLQKAEEKTSSFLFPKGTFDPGGVAEKVSKKVPFMSTHTIDVDKGTGLSGAIRKKVVKEPIQTGVTFASGVALGGVSSGLGVGVKATSKTGKALHIAGATATGIYGGVKTFQFASAPTMEAKEQVLAGTLYETAVFGAGAKVGSGIGTSVGYKIKTTNFDRSLNSWQQSKVGKGEVFNAKYNKGFPEYDVKGVPRQTQLKPTTESGFDIYTRQQTTSQIKSPDYLKQTSLYRFAPEVAAKTISNARVYVKPPTVTQGTLKHYAPKPSHIEISKPGQKPIKVKVKSSFWKNIGSDEYIPFSTARSIHKPQSISNYESIWGSSKTPSGLKPPKAAFSGASIIIPQASTPFFAPTSISISQKKSELAAFQELESTQGLELSQMAIQEPISQPIFDTPTAQEIGQIGKAKTLPKTRQQSKTKQSQIQIPISTPVQTPVPFNPPRLKPPTPTITRPPTKKPPTILPGFKIPKFRRFAPKNIFKGFKTLKFKTAYKPTTYSASLNIRKSPSFKASKTGLSIRPVPLSDDKDLKKKYRGLRL